MTVASRPAVTSALPRGVLAGLAGTAVMTAFQKTVEMPLTGRGDSDAPAQFAQTVLPLRVRTRRQAEQVNWVTHFALGAMWGSARALAAVAGLRGTKAIGAVFATVYTADVLLNTALGLYEPGEWSAQEWTVDVVDKLVQAAATGVIYDRALSG